MDLNTANKLHRDGRLADAERAYRALLHSAPRSVNATFLLGIVLAQLGRHAEAIDRLREAVRLAPTSPQVLGNLAGVLGSAGRHAEAVEVLTTTLRLRPDYAEGHENLGVALEHLGRLTEAEAAHREAIRLRPLFPEAHCNLGNVLHKLGRNEHALAEYHRAVELGHAQAYRNLAGALGGLGRAEEASACHRRLVELRPDDPVAGSEFLLSLHHLDSVTPQRMFEEHLRWARRFAEPLYPAADRHAGRRGGPGSGEGGRLRIGYVSPDFREYPAAHFFLPVLENHDRAKFDVFCYSDVSRSDAMTDRLRAMAENWREIAGLPDEDVDALIRRDRIDILVDLAGHMFNPRLLLFARKPAPVQATYIGYPNTTGLRTMDFRITDAWHDGHDDPRPSGSGSASTGSLTLAARSEDRSEDRCESVRNEPENNSVAWPSRLCLESKTQARTPMLQKTPRPGADPMGAFECTPGRAVSPLAASQIGCAPAPTSGVAASPIRDAASGGVVASETDAGPQHGESARNSDPTGNPRADLTRTSVTDAFHTERLVRLPRCCWAYAPGDGLPPVAPLPAEATRRITFGMMNRLVKVTPRMIELWSRIIAEVAKSRLLVLVPQGCEADPSVSKLFTDLGVDPNQLHLVPRRQRREYLELFSEIDIALDTCPYAGMTTTCDALWMGVPTVTLAGQTHVSRTGVSLLTAVGLRELIAETPEQYVRAATGLAADLPKLAALRAGLRERVARSPLADGATLAAAIESAYREMWMQR